MNVANRPRPPRCAPRSVARSSAESYIDHEVVYHQQVLDAVDKTLIPSAKNEELKALLVKVRPAFVAHLEHAKMIQSSMGAPAGTIGKK